MLIEIKDKRQFKEGLRTIATIEAPDLQTAIKLITDVDAYALENADLSSMDLSGIELNGVDFHKADFTNTNLSGACFTSCSFCYADFLQANLTGASFVHCHLGGIEARFADFTNATILNSNVSEAILEEAKGPYINLQNCDLTRTNLNGFDMSFGNLREAKLQETIMRGVVLKGADLRGAFFGFTDLRFADLSLANLSGCRVDSVAFCETNLRGATLKDTIFSEQFTYKTPELVMASPPPKVVPF